jgi:hypothetical protein
MLAMSSLKRLNMIWQRVGVEAAILGDLLARALTQW